MNIINNDYDVVSDIDAVSYSTYIGRRSASEDAIEFVLLSF